MFITMSNTSIYVSDIWNNCLQYVKGAVWGHIDDIEVQWTCQRLSISIGWGF